MYRKSLSYLKILVCAAFMMVTVSAVSPSAEAAYREVPGDGFCLYDNVYAPALPDHLFAEQSYCYISYNSFSGSYDISDYLLTLTYSSDPFVYDPSTETFTLSTLPASVYTYFYCSSPELASMMGFVYTGDWSVVGIESVDELNLMRGWSNHDVYNLDGNIASYYQPFYPLDGMICYLSDGMSETDYTIVSSYFEPPSSAVASILYSDYSGGYSDTITSYDDYWVIRNPYNLVMARSDQDIVYMAGLGSAGFFCNFFAYEPASDVPVGPDFSNTELIISNPEYDFQSADFDVSWSNLPNIHYPDTVQYYLKSTLNDSSSATPPYIYIGSSSDPPSGDVPVWIQFRDLQPSTDYTATVELRYASGDNASFSNSVPSGVTATVSFTTLSDGSISEGDKAIIDAIQNSSQQHEQWIDSEMGSAVGDLNEDVAAAEQQINDLNNQEEAFKDDAFARFQEVSASFSGFDGTVGSGIGLAGTLFSRFFNCLGDYAIIYTFPLILGLAMVIIGRLSRSSFSLEGKDSEKGGE